MAPLPKQIVYTIMADHDPAKEAVNAMPRKVKQPIIDDDNPEWTKADFAAATKFSGVRLKDLKPGTLARVQGTRGAQKAPTKIPVSIRLSPEVVNHFKKKGPGWQSRIDNALRKIVKKAS